VRGAQSDARLEQGFLYTHKDFSIAYNGAQIIGIVLWAADAPSLDPPWIFESWFANDRAATDASLIASDR
jgi:hypothetical protein